MPELNSNEAPQLGVHEPVSIMSSTFCDSSVRYITLKSTPHPVVDSDIRLAHLFPECSEFPIFTGHENSLNVLYLLAL